MMKRSYILIILFLVFIIFITIIGGFFVSGDTPVDVEDDILVIQANREVYFDVYGYGINNPNVIVNPYGNSPLTALIMFTSNDYSEVEVIIKGKNGSSDISYSFDKDKYHMIPIYGLYSDYDNTVIVRCEGFEKVINIKTDKLPDDFMYVDDMVYDNFVFYSNNYPYIIDNDGEVRWFLNSNYYGNITSLDNSSFIIGSDRYNEKGNVISFYKMNFLGKIYNEYIVNNYYGISALFQDNILVLSDDVLLIDVQTGEVISNIGKNVGYDYLNVYEEEIVVHKDDCFYTLSYDKLEKIDYNKETSSITFYNNTSNYKIVSSNIFGNLSETLSTDKKISLIGYNKLDKLENISVVREVDRIKVINNYEDVIYIILDKFMDKRIYEVEKLRYINLYGLHGKYTIYFKIENELYKTDYYVEVN